LPIQPPYNLGEEPIWVRLEFERVLRLGIGNDVFIRRGDVVKEMVGFVVLDDAILAPEQKQRRHFDELGSRTQVAVQSDAFHKKTSCGVVEGQRVRADEFTPARGSSEQLGIVERNREKSAWRNQAGAEDSKSFGERQTNLREKTGAQQNRSIHEAALPSLQAYSQLSAPGDGHKEQWCKPFSSPAAHRRGAQKLREVV